MVEDISAERCGSLLPSERFFTKPPIDEDLIYLIQGKLDIVGKAYRELANLDMWVAVANVTQMSAEYWMSQDVFWQRAYFQAVNEFVTQQNKKQKEANDAMTQSIANRESSTPYVSPMAHIPRPSFQLG